jgi:hypothetical protein
MMERPQDVVVLEFAGPASDKRPRVRAGQHRVVQVLAILVGRMLAA